MFLLRKDIDNKVSSSKKQSNDKTTITFIRHQLSLHSMKLSILNKEIFVLHVWGKHSCSVVSNNLKMFSRVAQPHTRKIFNQLVIRFIRSPN